MRSCPACTEELDEVFSASDREPGTLLAASELKYACPACELEWRKSVEGPLVPFG